jgi:hypothetical protein
MAERKARPPSAVGKADPEQFQRFLETARELGCEENFDRFEEALKRIVRAKPQPHKPGDRTPEPHESGPRRGRKRER